MELRVKTVVAEESCQLGAIYKKTKKKRKETGAYSFIAYSFIITGISVPVANNNAAEKEK